jgi:ElaA protein
MLSWSFKYFNDLSLEELYEIMKLRQVVFVVEQNCPYVDADDKDLQAYHLMGYLDGKLAAYLRILAPGISYTQDSSIGRVITSQILRGKGQGRPLMLEGIAHTRRLFPNHNIRISAQSHLISFYGSLGFVSTGKEYLEDDIPHTEMLMSFHI